MLTQIEWWGGLLIIWMVLCYKLLYKGLSRDEKLGLEFVSSSLAYCCASGVLALFFYSLESDAIQVGYAVALGIGLVSFIVMLLAPYIQKEDSVTAEEESDEEVGRGYEIAGQAILFIPLVVSLGLGGYKVYNTWPLLG